MHLHPDLACQNHDAPASRFGLPGHFGCWARIISINPTLSQQLQPPARDLRRHFLGRLLRNRAAEMHVPTVAGTEQFAHRQTRRLSKNVSTGNIKAALYIGMPFERGMHRAIEFHKLTGIFTNQARPELAQASPHASA